MPSRSDNDRTAIPIDALIFGFGPMLPLAAAATGAWVLPLPWPAIAIRLAVVWAAIILVFVAGVRRGFAFGVPTASTPAAISTMLAYFILGGLALVVRSGALALSLLALGFTAVLLFDTRAARRGNAPRYFARLRPPQMVIGITSLLILLWYAAHH